MIIKKDCCDRCGTPISQLKVFGKEGDPLAGNFKGKKLVKIYREMAQQNEEYDQILSECTFTDKSISSLQKKYGRDKVEQMLFYDQLVGTIAPSWECRDCIIT